MTRCGLFNKKIFRTTVSRISFVHCTHCSGNYHNYKNCWTVGFAEFGMVSPIMPMVTKTVEQSWKGDDIMIITAKQSNILFVKGPSVS